MNFNERLASAAKMAEVAAITASLANPILTTNLPPQENTAVIDPPLYSQNQEQRPNSCSLEQSQEEQQDPDLALREKVNEAGLPDDWAKDKENSQKTANESDTVGLAQDQAIESGSPEPSPSSMQENTSPTAQTQRESNADLASQMHDSPTGTADVSSEADEGSDTMG